MTYEQLKHLKASAFKRRCGIHQETFGQMVEVLRPELNRQGKRGGQCKLSVEDQLLLVLEYWREYRTQFHIATSWGLSESAVCRLIHKVERLLMDSGKFRLPGKKQLYQNAYTWSVLVVDVTESPIERPKKTRNATTVAMKLPAHPKNASGGEPSRRTHHLHCFWQRASPRFSLVEVAPHPDVTRAVVFS